MEEQEIEIVEERAQNWLGWVALGVGSGLLLGMVATAIYRCAQEKQSKDPRAQQVEDLIKEAERLLAQGRSSRKRS